MKTTESAAQQATALTQHFKAHASHLRIDTLQRLIDVLLAMIAARSINHHDLSAHMPGISMPQAKKRRADRTFRDEQLDMELKTQALHTVQKDSGFESTVCQYADLKALPDEVWHLFQQVKGY